MLDLRDVLDRTPERGRDALVAEADAQDRKVDLADELGTESKVLLALWAAGSRRQDDTVYVREDALSELRPIGRMKVRKGQARIGKGVRAELCPRGP